jgi:leucyl aminopeptidase
MQINFHTNAKQQGSLVLFINSERTMGKQLTNLDKDGFITKSINNTPSFEGKEGQIIHILSPQCCTASSLFVVCIGKSKEINALSLQRIGATVTDMLNQRKITSAEIVADDLAEIITLTLDETICNLLLGMRLKNYAFNHHYKKRFAEHKLYLDQVDIISQPQERLDELLIETNALADGTLLTRDLVAEPANILSPENFMKRAQELSALGINVTVINQQQMKELGMNALLGVSQGSASQAYTVVMEWKPDTAPADKTLALVGKGVCFDTGGINLKPTAGIADMKYDKAGAATVVGAMHAIASRKASAHVVGIIGLVENMPSGSAQRPSDVVVTMAGHTVEVGNTDAEGRLVLADIMHYVQEKYKITHMIDIATLTGAIVVALGESYAGLFSNNKEMSDHLYEIGEETGDLLWKMPMNKNYDRQIDSKIADISNDGGGRGAGSCTAAHFLQNFVKTDCKWAHLDIAGMAWNKNGTPLAPCGATGFGVKIFNHFVKKHFET